MQNKGIIYNLLNKMQCRIVVFSMA